MKETKILLDNCLYFSSNRFFRIMNNMAEREFKKIGLPPTYSFTILIISEKEGITIKEVKEKLDMASSTITRFIDKLENKKIVYREIEGKKTRLYLTTEGKLRVQEIKKSWENLYKEYSNILGEKEGKKLNEHLNKAIEIVEK